MYYVGKFFTNVRGLYNEINPATLTGAIDVIVVRQKDGTYTTSPWHVRFGKMSVIRTREKLVDIEINGEPADLHMKLGEAGEAFFVQETDDTVEVPAYLATSPISPVLTEMEAGLAALKVACASSSCAQDEPRTPVIEHCGTVITLEDGNMVVSGIPPPILSVEERQYFSDSDATVGGTLLSRRRRQKESVATQTNLLSSDIAYADFGRPATPPGDWYSGLLTESKATKSCVLQQQTIACSLPAACNSLPSTYAVKNKFSNHPLFSSVQAGKVDSVILSNGAVVSAEDCQFEMDLSDDERVLSPLPRLPESADLSVVGRCLSMPIIHHSDSYDIVDTWASKQYATTTMHGYTDITPTCSPVHSRPVSPLSDSEILNANRDATSQTHLTGTRLAMIDDVKWRWGEFPESSSAHRLSMMEATTSEESPPRPAMADDAISAVVTQSEKDNVVESLMSELTSTVFDTQVCSTINREPLTETSHSPSDAVVSCVSTSALEPKKAISKKPLSSKPEQGIYLEDLTQDEPEIAALYLYNRKSNSPQRVSISKDEDSESGRGASLPQSPVTVEAECRDASDTLCQKKFTLSSSLTCVVLSLCGPLDHEDTVFSDERFNQSLVTQDVLMENPNVLSDPNLVVKIDGRFYNWAVAAPMIMSNIVFKKPLTEVCMSRLISQHLPKKEPSSGGVWQRLWGRRGKTGGTGTTAAVSASSPPFTGKESGSAPSSHHASPPNTPQKCKGDSKSSASNVENVLTSDEEGEVLALPVTSEESKARQDESSTVHNPMRGEKCRKSLKLTSDEIARLNLKDGVNEVVFSVTTQYQGTTKCHCYVYLWQWDDRIVVSDIDGTITKSDVLGQVLPMIGSVLPYISTDWSQAGIAQLYQMISRNNYKFLYLSARAIGQSKLTRDYLRGVRQSDICLPDGPLLLSPSSLMSAFHKEVIERKPEQFKISCLRDISALFPPTENPFIAGFGNKINDVWAYREVGIPLSRIFTVNHKGELRMDSTQAFQSSYKRLSDIVDHLFPPRPSHTVDLLTVSNDYNSFSYWRNQVPVLDMAFVNDFIQTRDAALAADKSAKKTTAKKPVSAAVSAPAGITKSSRKADSKSVAK